MARRASHGFTLIELMVVVGTIGILAAIAIPNYITYQLTAKTAEARVHLWAIDHLERVYIKAHDRPLGCPATPNTVPGNDTLTFESSCWRQLGFQPESQVYYQYETKRRSGEGFIIYARGDLDGSREKNPEAALSLFSLSSTTGQILWHNPGVF